MDYRFWIVEGPKIGNPKSKIVSFRTPPRPPLPRPNLIGFLVFTAGPVLVSLVTSFTDRSLLTPEWHWIGLRNYLDLAGDALFWTYLVNTAYFFLGLPVSIAGSLFLATLLHQRLRGMAVFRTLLYLPSFTAGVALMILWKQLLNPDFGAINAGLKTSTWARRSG